MRSLLGATYQRGRGGRFNGDRTTGDTRPAERRPDYPAEFRRSWGVFRSFSGGRRPLSELDEVGMREIGLRQR